MAREILIVDDEADIRMLITGILDDEGFETREASNSTETLDEIHKRRPDLVILDEPTAGLDPAQLREVRDLIRGLGEEHAVILSTHVLPEAQTLCDRVQIIDQGRSALSVDLDRLDEGDNHRVRLARPPELDALRGLEPVAEAWADGGDAFRVRLSGGDAALAAFAGACSRQGWGLLELTPCRRSLEEVFIAVACGEPDAGPR